MVDPPYMEETRVSTGVYTHEFSRYDHERLLRIVSNVKGKALICGYDNDLYRERRRADGVCVRCGGEKDPLRATCSTCAEKRRQRRKQPTAPPAVRWNDPPQAGRYRTIVIDPPWPITRTKPGKTAPGQGV